MRRPDVRALLVAAAWLLVLIALTLVLRHFRDSLDQVHVVLAYLLVVLGGSASGGRALGLSLAVGCFLLIDYFFQAPYNQLSVSGLRDWTVLLAFLCTAAVTTHLLSQARSAAEHKAHAHALREAERLREVLLASVSHDLRTPLTTIKALAEDSAREGDRNAAVIAEQAERLARLVSDLLDLSRLRAGGFAIEAEANSIEDLIGAAIRQVGGLRRQTAIRTIIDPDAPALYASFDFVQTVRVLSNLLENAVRFTPPGETVEVRAAQHGADVRVVVADRGPGVPAAERERIFEPFYRGDTARSAGAGSGLGLAIARHIAAAQGGSVRWQPREGGGSEFVLTLAAAQPDLADPAGNGPGALAES